MSELKDLQNLKKDFDLFDLAIKNNNIDEIKSCIKLIKLYEDSFLKSYRKKKREGVYYTNEQTFWSWSFNSIPNGKIP